MNAEQILLVTPQGWSCLAQGELRPVSPWPDLKGSAIVVVDFADSQVGVQSSKGKPEYAAAQIEKAVRAEGAVEGPLKVFVHKQVRHTDSSQSLYTAVALEDWQQFETWASRQPDHCLIVPVVALLAGASVGDKIRLLRIGQNLHAYAESDNRLHFATAAALGSDATDFVAPVRTVLAQLRASGWKGSNEVRWGTALADDLAAEQDLVAQLAALGATDAKLLAHASYRAGTGKAVSAIPCLLEELDARSLTASFLERLAWLSERYVMPLMALVAVVTLGLGGFALYAEQMIARERQGIDSLQGEMKQLRARVDKVTATQAASVEGGDLAFARQLGFAATHDPIRMLTTVRRAAGSTVRVQRVQLTKVDQSSKARFRVDGVVANGSSAELSRFLGELRAQGWQAESTAPSDGTAGAFAYFLRPLAPGGKS